MSAKKEIAIGTTFTRLTVVGNAPSNNEGKAVYVCRCECGTETHVTGKYLRGGNTKSCGCLGAEHRREASMTHGMSDSKEYRAWRNMIDRCSNPNNTEYHCYGGRGIKVCSEWRNSFEAFFNDVGPIPKGLTIDRIDVNGNYEKSNIRLATQKQQGRNKTNNHLVEMKGEIITLAEASERTGISYDALRARIKRGYKTPFKSLKTA